MRRSRCFAVVLMTGLLLGGLLGPAPPTAAQTEACFAATGRCIRGRFLDYWQENGGLARNGFPLSEERRELLEDGREYTVQYFERVRLELHPEHPPPYDVLLGQFGRRVLIRVALNTGKRTETLTEPSDPIPGQAYFPQTGHNLGGAFLAYWEANGGLPQFGYPITEVFEEFLYSAGSRRVQYFERVRLELHPENAPPYDVLLGQFGRQILAENDLLVGDFGVLYRTDERVRAALGPPLGSAMRADRGATQGFERGRMFYDGGIYVLCGDPQSGRAFPGPRASFSLRDPWHEGEPVGGGPGPAPGLYEPRYGFGKLWRERPDIRGCLGYATAPEETYYPITTQRFVSGVMLSTPDGRAVYVLFSGGDGPRYERFPIPGR